LERQVLVDQTPEGLCIQLIDAEGRPMYAVGASEPTDAARLLLRLVAQAVAAAPNRLSLSGHTSVSLTGGEADWALSAARAEAARRLLLQGGVAPDRIHSVVGRAGADPLYPDAPERAGNRRLTIILLHEAPLLAPGRPLRAAPV
jgi:chemotaxis protein MotB